MNTAENILHLSVKTTGWRARLQDWSELSKARLTSLVLLTTLVGLYCGAGGQLEPWRTLFTLSGTVLVAAAAAVLNEWLERDLDARMLRTAQRGWEFFTWGCILRRHSWPPPPWPFTSLFTRR